jgi:hypothetical protein
MPACVKCGSQAAHRAIIDKENNIQDCCDDCFKTYDPAGYKEEMDEYRATQKGEEARLFTENKRG